MRQIDVYCDHCESNYTVEIEVASDIKYCIVCSRKINVNDCYEDRNNEILERRSDDQDFLDSLFDDEAYEDWK